MKTFTIEEIKNYLKQQDSLGDVLYNLTEENITKANKTISFTYGEILDSRNWADFCDKYGINEWCINEGADRDTNIQILVDDAKKYNLI